MHDRKFESEESGARLEGPIAEFVEAAIPLKETVLDEAARLVDGSRQSDYGHPKDNYDGMAKMVSAVLAGKLKEDVDALDCVRMLICMKLVRDAHRVKRDNWVDTAGYARVGEMIAAVDELFDAEP